MDDELAAMLPRQSSTMTDVRPMQGLEFAFGESQYAARLHMCGIDPMTVCLHTNEHISDPSIT